MPFDKVITGEKATGLIQPEVVNEVIAELPQQSVVLKNAQHRTMSSAKQTQPVLDLLPEAFWVRGNNGLKETTEQAWTGLEITAEELAVILPIPDAIVDDANINLWDAVKGPLAEAFGKKIDAAVLFGADKPTTWPEGVVEGAKKAGNTIALTKQLNHADAALQMGEKVSSEGFAINGFAARAGLSWKLRGLKDAMGNYYYGSPAQPGMPASFFGYGLEEVRNGAWDNTQAELIGLDWTKFIVGIRQDMTYKIFDQGVITDSNGKVIYNLMQQDSKALRVVMRLGFQIANPVTALQSAKAKRYPAFTVTPGAAG